MKWSTLLSTPIEISEISIGVDNSVYTNEKCKMDDKNDKNKPLQQKPYK